MTGAYALRKLLAANGLEGPRGFYPLDVADPSLILEKQT
jgi:hypothetical protein